jgi:hypothetical protein
MFSLVPSRALPRWSSTRRLDLSSCFVLGLMGLERGRASSSTQLATRTPESWSAVNGESL